MWLFLDQKKSWKSSTLLRSSSIFHPSSNLLILWGWGGGAYPTIHGWRRNTPWMERQSITGRQRIDIQPHTPHSHLLFIVFISSVMICQFCGWIATFQDQSPCTALRYRRRRFPRISTHTFATTFILLEADGWEVFPRLTRMKAALINGCVRQSNEEVSETIHHA